MENAEQPQQVATLKEFEMLNISAGQFHSAAITCCGKLFTWGNNDYKQLMIADSLPERNLYFPVEVKLPTPAKQVSCGNEHTLVIGEDKKLYLQGSNSKGQLGEKSSEAPFIISHWFDGTVM